MRWANLNGAELSGAELSGADLSTALISDDTVFKGAIYNAGTKLPFGPGEARNFGMVYKDWITHSLWSNKGKSVSFSLCLGALPMPFELPSLPYPKDALMPHISPETLDYHYGKHHKAYVDKLNDLLTGHALAQASLEEIIKKSDGAIFNNAAQVWNHTFYWNCLAPRAGGAPTGKVAELINQKWGSFDKFKQDFTQSSVGLFGSGWAWLVRKNDGSLSIVQKSNAGTPLTDSDMPILTCDVWEHAYYVDYRNARPKYMDAFWNLVNWDFANRNLA